MGVLGLTTFIADHPEVFVDYKLHDTKIVLDGNNLFYTLYYSEDISYRYGGDYDHFAQVVAKFFHSLKKCNIEPYVVFDGGYEKGKKLHTIIDRAVNRLQMCLDPYAKGKVLPILAHSVFVNTLDFIRVRHVCCDYEADEQIAALAVKWKCPVISKDSDFFIYNLPNGFIPIDLLNTNFLKENGVRFLKVKIYYRQIFAESFGFNEDFMPLFATLLGNDHVRAYEFETFIAHIKKNKCSSKRVASRNAKIRGILKWFQHQCLTDDVYSLIVSHQKKETQKRTMEILQKSVESYTNLKSGLHHYFDSSDGWIDNLTECLGNVLPREFATSFRKCKLSRFHINVAVNQRVILLSQIEDVSQPSSYMCSTSLRQATYSIVLGSTNSTARISEYDRHGKTLSKTMVVQSVASDIHVPTINDVPNLSVSERRDIVLTLLNADPNLAYEFPDGFSMFLAAVIHWANKAINVTKNHLRAFVICWIKLGALDHFGSEKKVNSTLNVVLKNYLLQNCGQKCLIDAKDNLKKFHTQPIHNSNNTFDCKIVHGFAQLQATILDVIHLNQVLLLPFPEINAANFFNGALVYNLYCELMRRKDPDLYVQILLIRGSMLSEFYLQVVACIEKYTNAEKLLPHNLKVKKRKKSRQLGTQKRIYCTSDQSASSSDDEKVNSDSLECRDLNNRFSLLNCTASVSGWE